jgi:hypothetical protein
MQIQSLFTYSVFGTENVSLKSKESLNTPNLQIRTPIDHKKEGCDTAKVGEGKREASILIPEASSLSVD